MKLADVCAVEKQVHDGSPLPYVGLEDIESSTGRYLGDFEPKTVQSNSFRFTPEHLLYGRLRPYLNKLITPEFTGHCSTEIFPIRPSEQLDRKFLFYWLSMQQTVDQIDGTCTGARMPRANMNEVMDFEFLAPSLPEQKRIVAILDEAFAGIAAATANAEKNLANARELFDGHLKALFDEEQPTWERKTLRQASLDFGRGKSKHRPRNDPKLYGGKYPFIQTGDVRNCDHVILESTQTYNESGLAQSKLWPKGTICITIAANIAETGILGFDACFPDSVIGMVVDPKQTTNDFVEYLLRSVQAQLKAAGKGSAQDNINLATFEDRPFPFPELEEQARIVETLNELSSFVRQLEDLYGKKLSALAELKQALLQKAFSGELTGIKTRHCEAA